MTVPSTALPCQSLCNGALEGVEDRPHASGQFAHRAQVGAPKRADIDDAGYSGWASGGASRLSMAVRSSAVRFQSPARTLAATCSAERTPAMMVATAGCAASQA